MIQFSSYLGITIIILCLLSLGRLEFIWDRNCLFTQFSVGSLILENTEPSGNTDIESRNHKMVWAGKGT